MVRDALIGLAVGDALGVPVEFKSRDILKSSPITDMIGFGTHQQPAGTWSDDSSLAFCLAECLVKGYNTVLMGDLFVKWLYSAHWTPHGRIFDVGMGTSRSIKRIKEGCPAEIAGGMDEEDNGNGSLMRILPLVFFILDKPIEERFKITKEVSSVTHAHIRSVIACFYYLEFARLIIKGESKEFAYREMKTHIPRVLKSHEIVEKEITLFQRLLHGDIDSLPEDKVYSSGYVLHTLEASIWCLLTTNSYSAAVLKSVNLGSDTDTTGAVTGGLAGIVYGYDNIPRDWVLKLARVNEVLKLADDLSNSLAV
jgi:ADP-ribosyl-[dinitrogen reductase] hydrolase